MRLENLNDGKGGGADGGLYEFELAHPHQGHRIYGRRMYETWVQMTALIKTKRLDLDPLFGERLPLERFEEAFAAFGNGSAGKILLYPNSVLG